MEKAYSPKPGSKNPLSHLKGIDGSLTPPCKAELIEHIRLSSFVARMWVNANCNNIDQDPQPSHGWDLVNGMYEPKMFEGE